MPANEIMKNNEMPGADRRIVKKTFGNTRSTEIPSLEQGSLFSPCLWVAHFEI